MPELRRGGLSQSELLPLVWYRPAHRDATEATGRHGIEDRRPCVASAAAEATAAAAVRIPLRVHADHYEETNGRAAGDGQNRPLHIRRRRHPAAGRSSNRERP